MKKIILAALLLWVTATGSAQQLSNDIIPSEDELWEALNQGEIDNEHYLILQEIFNEGINENNIHLLEEIPYLQKYFITNLKDYSTYQKDQLDYLNSFSKKNNKGSLTYKYYQKFNENEDARYRIKTTYKFNQTWQFDLRLQKEYSSNERIVQRSLYYQSKGKIINYLFVGNYSKKIGLGTVFGYRGKLLDFSDRLDDESFLFPDYGGKNGFIIDLGKKNYNAIIFSNVVRDNEHLFRSIGGAIKQTAESFAIQPVVSVTRLSNRLSTNYVDDLKTGINFSKRYKENINEVELTFQNGIKKSFAIVTEGVLNFWKNIKVNYSLWNYSDDYFDLESGSKSGSLWRKNELQKIDYSFSSRRSGQRGGLVSLNSHLYKNLQLYNSILYSKINNDSLLLEYSPSLLKQHTDHLLFRFDYIYKYKQKSLSIIKESRVRAEVYYKNKDFQIRNNLFIKYKTGSQDYIGWFSQIRWETKTSEYEIWSNLSKIDIKQMRNDYWYFYIQHKFKMAKSLSGVTKLSHSYSRNLSAKHITTISSEIRVAL